MRPDWREGSEAGYGRAVWSGLVQPSSPGPSPREPCQAEDRMSAIRCGMAQLIMHVWWTSP